MLNYTPNPKLHVLASQNLTLSKYFLFKSTSAFAEKPSN